MKLNLECGQDALLGFKNIEQKPSTKLSERGNFKDLTALGIMDGTVEEIRSGNCLRKIYMDELPGVVGHWKNKLKPGGRLYITGLDADIISNGFANNQFGIDELNRNLFGSAGEEPSKSLFSLVTMKMFITRVEMKIIECGYNDKMFFIECEK